MTSPTFDETLQAQAGVRPDDTALVDARTHITYGELDDHTGRLARHLTAAGTRPGDRVVLSADNSVHHVAVACAVWRAGATLVTIYPSSTAAEFEYAIDNAQPTLVIAATRVVPTVRSTTSGLGVRLVELTEAGTVIGLADTTDDVTRPLIDPHALALICYTSGSTSRPKAVMHSHAGLLAAARSYARVWHLVPTDTTLVALPLAWAFGLVTTTMATLTAGGQVLLLARGDPDDMLANFTRHEVTVFAGVTTMFVKMVGSLDRDSLRPRPATLRLCISGGEPRNDVAFERWRALTGCPVHDVYAASECFPVVTYDPELDPSPKPGSAGRVVPDAELRLIDIDGTDSQTGPGEAWVRGPALMLGYWRDPELTNAVLTPDGWYRTGDLVEVDNEGYVRVVGRLSDLIIRGGANVSPAEVESVLVRHPLVREAAVVGLPDADHGEQVVAAIVFEPLASALEDGLRAHCAASLAGYKVPSRVVPVPQLPRNPNTGKVQRREVAALLASLLSESKTGKP